MTLKERGPRKSIELGVHLKDFTFTKTADESAENISMGGAFITMADPYSPGTLLKFEIRVSDDRLIKGVGRVVWYRKEHSDEKGPPGIGIKFAKLGDKSQKMLEEIMSDPDLKLVATSEPPPEAASGTTSEPSPQAAASHPPEPDEASIEKAEPDEALPAKTKPEEGKPEVGGMPVMKKTLEGIPIKSFVKGKAPSEEKPEERAKREQKPESKTDGGGKENKKGLPSYLWILGVVALIALIWWMSRGEEEVGESAEPQVVTSDEAPPEEAPKAAPEKTKEASPAPPVEAPEPEPEPTPAEEVKGPPPADLATLEVTSTPEGATVSVNDAVHPGVTPLTIETLPLGKVAEISVHLAGYQKVTEKYVATEKSGTLNVALKPAVLKFQMNSKPNGARIIIDGKWNGYTPHTVLRMKYKPTFEFEIEHRGFESIKGTITEKDWVEKGRWYIFTFDTPLKRKK